MNAIVRERTDLGTREVLPAPLPRTGFVPMPTELARLFDVEPRASVPAEPAIRRLPSGGIDFTYYERRAAAARRQAIRDAGKAIRAGAVVVAVAGVAVLIVAVISAASS